MRITPISSGVEYLLRAAGCGEHDHGEHAHDHGAEQGKHSSKGAEYLLKSKKAGEPAGRWHGSGLGMVGMQAGTPVTAETMRAIYGRLEHPVTGDPLGSRPRKYATFKERLAKALAAEPLASEERRKEIRQEAKASGRKSVGYYDLTFTGRKSESVFLAALRAAGLHEKADAVVAAHVQAVREALNYLQANVITTRVGRHATVEMADGRRRSVGKFAKIKGFIVTTWVHSSSRELDPHMHTHAALLNRVETVDGEIFAFDGQQLKALKGCADVIYERRMEELIGEATGAVYAWRPDGRTREILGIDPVLCDESSGRRRAIQKVLDELVENYRNEHGHEPGRQAMSEMRRYAWADTRAAKTTLSPEEVAERYVAKHGLERLADQVVNVEEAARRVAEQGLPAGQPSFESEDELLQEAVKRTQAQWATWDRTALALEVNKLVGGVKWSAEEAPAEIDRLVDRALSPEGPSDVLPLKARERVEVPKELRVDGREEAPPIYQVAGDQRFATRDHVAAEKELVADTQLELSPRLNESEAPELRADLERQGLSGDQVNAVVGVMCSGRAADIVIGPAGTGKTKTVTQIDRVWKLRVGAPVIGVATSQMATNLMAEDGLKAMNVTAFLARYGERDGKPGRLLPEHTLVVIDEAGMADTGKLRLVAALVRRARGKILYTGDDKQLPAVGSGGLLRLLVEDAPVFELAKVWRFVHEWEAAASLQFRAGDTSALDEYERRGRLRAGTREEMAEAAVRGYLADVLDGHSSVLVARDNKFAAHLAARVRMELQALGRVGTESLGYLRDGTCYGVGDLIQARKIDHHADTDHGDSLVNREVLEVVGRHADGRLVARRADGSHVRLTGEYLRRHVTLAYAGTVHGVQGMTVHSSHSLLERGMSANHAYVENTRGTHQNHLYGITETPVDPHQLEEERGAIAELVRRIVDSPDQEISATQTHRAALESSDSLREIGALWSVVSYDAMRDRHRAALLAALGPERMERVEAEGGHHALMAAMQRHEMTGRDVVGMVKVAAARRELDTATSIADVMRWRIDKAAERDEPDSRPPWGERIAGGPMPLWSYANELGRLMDQRIEMIERAAVHVQPEWALVQLGPMPDDMKARGDWLGRVGKIGAYREIAGIPADEMTLGPAPGIYQDPVKYVAWQDAWIAAGKPEDAVDFSQISGDDLQGMVREWEAAQEWAPFYVSGQMQEALTRAEEFRREAVLRWEDVRAELDATDGEVTEEVDELVKHAERAERRVVRFQEAARRYERLDLARQRWSEHTAPVAERAGLAHAELKRRGDITAPAPREAVQTELLDERGGRETDYARHAQARYEASALVGDLVEPETPAPAVMRARGDRGPEVVDAEVVDERKGESRPPAVEVEERGGLVGAAVGVAVAAKELVGDGMGAEAGEDVHDVAAAARGPEAAAATVEQDVPEAERVEDEHVSDVEEATSEAAGADVDEPLEGELVDEEDAPEAEADAPEDVVDAEIVPDAQVADHAREDLDAADAEAGGTEYADLPEEEQAELRGDYGTPYRLDEIGEADVRYPKAEVDADQGALFDVEPTPEDRISAGRVREDEEFTVRDADVRAKHADAKEAREQVDELAEERAQEQERQREEEAQAKADREAEKQLERERKAAARAAELEAQAEEDRRQREQRAWVAAEHAQELARRDAELEREGMRGLELGRW